MFEKASRLKLQFEGECGRFGADQLWDLDLLVLNAMAIALNDRVQVGSISFIQENKGPDPLEQLRFDIIKHVIKVRLAEAKEVREEKSRSGKKQHLLELIKRKQNEGLTEMSIDELRAEMAKV